MQCLSTIFSQGCMACCCALCRIDAPLFCPACLRLPCLCALLQKLPVCFLGSSPSCSSACRRSSECPRFAEGCWRARVVFFRHAIADTSYSIQPGQHWGSIQVPRLPRYPHLLACLWRPPGLALCTISLQACSIRHPGSAALQGTAWSRGALRHTTRICRYLIPPLLACGADGFCKALTGHLALPQASARSPRMQLH